MVISETGTVILEAGMVVSDMGTAVSEAKTAILKTGTGISRTDIPGFKTFFIVSNPGKVPALKITAQSKLHSETFPKNLAQFN